MRVAIHQPHYLPWLGLLQRMRAADLFIVLDHVQFERGNYQNRARVLIAGEPRWLTVPVVQRSQGERIADKRIDNSLAGRRHWAAVHFETLRRSYASAGFFGSYAGSLKKIYEQTWDRLVDLNDATLAFLRDAFAIRTPLVKSSQLGVGGAKSDLVLNLCRAVGADALIVGLGGSREYLEREAFARAGIALEPQQFAHPVYRQCGAGAFTPGLAAIDMLFNTGWDSGEARLAA